MAHFAAEDFAFTHLTLGHCKLTAKGVEQLANLNTDSIKRLNLAFNMPTLFFKSLV